MIKILHLIIFLHFLYTNCQTCLDASCLACSKDGSYCYMNSVLQCFSNIYSLTNYFLNPEKEQFFKMNNINMSNKDADSLSIIYKELIDNLWKGMPKVPYAPYKFRNKIGKLNTLFKDGVAGDSKDFACYLIMQLHQELNNIDNDIKDKNNNMNINENVTVNPYDRNEVLNFFLSDFAINQSSIISKIFYGTNQSMFECQICKMNNMQKGIRTPLIKYNFENFFFLEFPLDEVRKYKMELFHNQGMNLQMNYQMINEVDIFDCFKYYFKGGDMNGYCDKCGQDNAKILTQTQIFNGPNILMIVFNRGKGLQFKIKINFNEQLMLPVVSSNTPQIYELYGVIKHLGDSSDTGHFIAYCKPPIQNYQNNWYCFNDSTVVEVKNKNDIINIGNTYILFYKLKKSNPNNKY